MVDPGKIFLRFSLITMQNLVTVFHIVCAHIGGPINLGDAGTSPLGTGALLIPKNTPLPHMYYGTEFSRSRLNMCVDRGFQ